MNQPHLFENWSTETTEHDGVKLDFMAQLVRMDKTYPSGGLVGYIKNARELLAKSKRGENPLEGWTPSVPDGEMFEIGTESYDKFEAVGLGEMGKCGFALVAGGLGERLGYGGIKVSSKELSSKSGFWGVMLYFITLGAEIGVCSKCLHWLLLILQSQTWKFSLCIQFF